jgi:hypothetical protein
MLGHKNGLGACPGTYGHVPDQKKFFFKKKLSSLEKKKFPNPAAGCGKSVSRIFFHPAAGFCHIRMTDLLVPDEGFLHPALLLKFSPKTAMPDVAI